MKKMKSNEWLRKKVVYLKRNPNIIPLLFIIVSCLIYNLRLTQLSNTTAIIYASGMGFTMFVITLCSFLSIISYIQAFPRRKKPKVFLIIATFVLMGISLIADGFFYYSIIYGTKLRTDPAPIEITSKTAYITTATNTIIVHFIFVCLSILVMAFLPLIKKMINKIDTSVNLHDETQIEKIELSDE